MSRIIETVAQRAGGILTVDLGAIVSNYLLLRRMTGTSDCAGVVKADAYGLGASEVALALYGAGCRTFFVAHVSEGIELRSCLPPGSIIFVLNGMPKGTEGDFLDRQLIPVLNSRREIGMWGEYASKAGRRLPAAIQLDSGMSRLGLSPGDVEAVALDSSMLSCLDLRLILSHLACANETENPANEHQRTEFNRLRAMLPLAPASLANSSGIFLGNAWHLDVVRPGAALYGINPQPGRANPMCQTVRLSARIIQLRHLGKGKGIGYGHTVTTQEPKRLATISLGYADGWPRNAAMAAFINGFRLPIIGTISMDSIILDVSDCPESLLGEEEWVDLICDDQTVDHMATMCNTIGYEVLTGIGHRLFRYYSAPGDVHNKHLPKTIRSHNDGRQSS